MIFALLVFSFAIQLEPKDAVFSFQSELGLKRILYALCKSHLERSPEWPSDVNCPPISPRKAIEIGNNGLKMLENKRFLHPLNASSRWNLEQASLVPVDNGKWFWKLSYEQGPKEGHGATGISAVATVVVLMDGTILLPIVSEEE